MINWFGPLIHFLNQRFFFNASFLLEDSVIDGPHSIVYQEAENRLHVQKAIMDCLINHPEII